MTVEMLHEIEIARSPEAVYSYVTQPSCWHEWHPNSKSARAEVETLSVGDCFDEVIELQPLAPLPWTMRRQTRYRVLEADPGRHWRVRGETRDGWLEIDYRLDPTHSGTRFLRGLSFAAGGATALLVPLLARRMRSVSMLALQNLKRRLEAGD